MHVLTKIFIVLVALLSVVMVPLVVVYTHNENAFQARYQASEAQLAAARSRLDSQEAINTAQTMLSERQRAELQSTNNELRGQLTRQEEQFRTLQAQLQAAESVNADIQARLATIASTTEAGQQLTASLIEELRGLRQEALLAERRKSELDEALRDTRAKLEVAIEARRALSEQYERLREEHAQSMLKLERYAIAFGAVPDEPSRLVGTPINIRLDASILNVRRSTDQVLAEIDAGSTDGVKEGMIVTIGRGADYIGKLRINSVDINRSWGVVQFESAGQQVKFGDTVLFRPSSGN